MRSVVTIGIFDGVHMGHRAVIKKAITRAKARGLTSALVTFDPHPLKVLSRSHFVPSLLSLKHRINVIKGLGMDKVIVMKFDRKLADLPAERFVKEVLIKKAGADEIFVGEDFRFGKGARSGVGELKAIGHRCGIKVNVVEHVKMHGAVVSSTLIRRLVVAGRIAEASKLLGRPFSILGTVVSGAKLGRSLGYPTANVNPHHEAMPPSGVYAVRVAFKGRLFKGIMNIGVKPTFYEGGRDEEPSIEVHIFNFHYRIYGKDLEITFAKKLRAEKKFKTIDSLVMQIKKDEARARKALGG